jgi:hypothetical protein
VKQRRKTKKSPAKHTLALSLALGFLLGKNWVIAEAFVSMVWRITAQPQGGQRTTRGEMAQLACGFGCNPPRALPLQLSRQYP